MQAGDFAFGMLGCCGEIRSVLSLGLFQGLSQRAQWKVPHGACPSAETFGQLKDILLRKFRGDRNGVGGRVDIGESPRPVVA